MIYTTQNQLNCLLIFLFLGFIFGIFFHIYNLIFAVNFQKKLLKTLFLSIFYSFFSIFFIILINFFNLGQVSIVLIITYILGFIWAKNIFSNLVVYLEKKWYNKLTKILQNKKRKKSNGTTKES